MITLTLSDEEAAVLLRVLETGRVSSGEKRFVIIPLIENLKAMQGDDHVEKP